MLLCFQNLDGGWFKTFQDPAIQNLMFNIECFIQTVFGNPLARLYWTFYTSIFDIHELQVSLRPLSNVFLPCVKASSVIGDLGDWRPLILSYTWNFCENNVGTGSMRYFLETVLLCRSEGKVFDCLYLCHQSWFKYSW